MEVTPHGVFHWNELLTNDVAASKDFYAKALGWTYESMQIPGGEGTYTIALSNGKPVGGMYQMQGPQFQGVPPHWMAYISVDDIDSRVANAVKLGAKVTMPPMNIEGVGRFAVLQDATGAHIGWITPAPCVEQAK
jgi:hypothetical protein